MEMSRSLMGAETFFKSPKTLARQRLDLGRWHGNQEVLFRESLELRGAKCSTRVAEDAYVIVVFGVTSESFHGLRLSNNSIFPSCFFHATRDGAFRSMQPVDIELDPGRWYEVELEFSDRGTRAQLDGNDVGTYSAIMRGLQTIGFRGGQYQALIDDVEFYLADGSRRVESFGSQALWLSSTGAMLAFLFLLNGAILLIGRRRAASKGAAFAALMLTLTGLGCTGLYIVADTYLLGRGYFRHVVGAEESFRHEQVAEISKQIRSSHATAPQTGTVRVLFLGTSQTWGSGAASDDATLVAAAERILNADTSNPTVYECINGGVSALGARWLADLLETDWIALGPHIVVVNLGNNDSFQSTPEQFKQALEKIVSVCTANGSKVLFALEANSVEKTPGPLPQHHTMSTVGKTHEIPVVDVHTYMREQAHRGLAWWDVVHPTSFGHSLIAEALVPHIVALAAN
jgi:lysophospholipase L1-like esterase